MPMPITQVALVASSVAAFSRCHCWPRHGPRRQSIAEIAADIENFTTLVTHDAAGLTDDLQLVRGDSLYTIRSDRRTPFGPQQLAALDLEPAACGGHRTARTSVLTDHVLEGVVDSAGTASSDRSRRRDRWQRRHVTRCSRAGSTAVLAVLRGSPRDGAARRPDDAVRSSCRRVGEPARGASIRRDRQRQLDSQRR